VIAEVYFWNMKATRQLLGIGFEEIKVRMGSHRQMGNMSGKGGGFADWVIMSKVMTTVPL
jgi:hypothetical protein